MTHPEPSQAPDAGPGIDPGTGPDLGGTANAEDVATFTKMADAWWDPHGKFRPLHQINPVRIAFIRDHAAAHFGLDAGAAKPLDKPLAGLDLLDIGAGGGLLAEPMARLGANVTGLDAGAKNVKIARLHAEQSGLEIDYRHQLPEDMAREGRSFDIVLNMEVVEHVADVDAFLAASAALVKPGGMMVMATLNRTLKSLALAKIGAEYILRWLPAGTHDWRKFLKPSELARGLEGNGLTVRDIRGMAFNPFRDEWSLGRDIDVNYLMMAVKDA